MLTNKYLQIGGSTKNKPIPTYNLEETYITEIELHYPKHSVNAMAKLRIEIAYAKSLGYKIVVIFGGDNWDFTEAWHDPTFTIDELEAMRTFPDFVKTEFIDNGCEVHMILGNHCKRIVKRDGKAGIEFQQMLDKLIMYGVNILDWFEPFDYIAKFNGIKIYRRVIHLETTASNKQRDYAYQHQGINAFDYFHPHDESQVKLWIENVMKGDSSIEIRELPAMRMPTKGLEMKGGKKTKSGFAVYTIARFDGSKNLKPKPQLECIYEDDDVE